MIKFRAAMVSVLVSLFVLTGCGGGEEVAQNSEGAATANAPVKNVTLNMRVHSLLLYQFWVTEGLIGPKQWVFYLEDP